MFQKVFCTFPAAFRHVVCCAAATAPSSPLGPKTFSSGRRVHIPAVQHAILPSDAARPRTIIIGDIHGCLEELKALLAACRYDERTTRVVLVGDLVNKGPASAECVTFVRTAGFHCVRGNHDDAALFAWEQRETERQDGGAAEGGSDKYSYTESFSKEDVEFLASLPHTLRITQHQVLVVHAGLEPDVALRDQEAAGMITMRNLLPGGGWTAKHKEGKSWAKAWSPDEKRFPGVAHVVFGHDAKRGLQKHQHATGLDTGACYGKELTALVLPERKIVSVAAGSVYSAPGSGD